MTAVCLYFKVHQPFRLQHDKPCSIDLNEAYEEVEADRLWINQVSEQCYLPANRLLQKLIAIHQGRFRVSFSISGTTLELLSRYRPDVLQSFRSLADTGNVEILAETYYHSLSFLHARKEFIRQVRLHSERVQELFGVTPAVFRNTELMHNNELARCIADMGYAGLLCEGEEKILKGRTANRLYAAPGNGDFALLLRNQALSDDIAFRFGDPQWSEHPLTAAKFGAWLKAHPESTDVINLFMDYETFGVHNTPDSGIFQFLDGLPAEVLTDERFCFACPSDVIFRYYPRDLFDAPHTISWNECNGGHCVWDSNAMQTKALKKMYAIENMVWANATPAVLDTWGRLQAADHLYGMRNPHADGCALPEGNENPEKAFDRYSGVLTEFELALIRNTLHKTKKAAARSLPAFNLY